MNSETHQSTSVRSTERRCRSSGSSCVCPPISPQSLNPSIALLCGRSWNEWRDSQHFAGILVATAPDDPVTFDSGVGNFKPVPMSWVGAAIAKIAKGDTFSAAWKNLIPTPDTYDEVLASVQAHAAGLFKHLKGRQPRPRLMWTTSTREMIRARQTTKDC